MGVIRFIGELYKLRMLTPKIMHGCVTKLIKDPTDEEALECLAGLLTTVGKDLEKDTNEKVKQVRPEDREKMFYLRNGDSLVICIRKQLF